MDIRMKWYYRLGFLLLLFIVIFVFLKLQLLWLPIVKILGTIFFPFFISAFITYLLHPIIEKLHESGLHRGLAIFIIYTVFFGGIGYAVYKGLPAIILQLKDLAVNIPHLSDHYIGFVDNIQKKTAAWPDGIQTRIDEGIIAVEQAAARMLTNVLNSLLGIVNSMFTVALIPFISFYMLKDFPILKKAAWYLTPRKWRKEGIILLREIDSSLGSYIRGQLLVCAVIGTLSTLLFWVFHMKYPLLLGMMIGITNIIPYFGPIIGAIPAVLIASTMSVKMVLITVAIIFVLQFLEGNILSPFIVGKSLHMHPLLIMFALLAGGEIGGIAGLILAVPILAVIKVSLLHARKYFGKKHRVHLDPS